MLLSELLSVRYKIRLSSGSGGGSGDNTDKSDATIPTLPAAALETFNTVVPPGAMNISADLIGSLLQPLHDAVDENTGKSTSGNP